MWGGLGVTSRLGTTHCSHFFPTGIAGKVQASEYSPMGKYPAPISPQTHNQTRQGPIDLP